MADGPCVLLIGWTGHSPKHLVKYGEVFEALGYQPITYSSHSWHMIGTDKKKETRYATEVVDIIRKKEPVAIMAFSNGGARVVADAFDLCLNDQEDVSPFPSVKHVIYDSAPGQFNLQDIPSMLNFFWTITGMGPPAGKFLKRAGLVFMLVPGLILFVMAYFFRLQFLLTRNMTFIFWCSLLRGGAALNCPHLLLFSVDDALIPAKHVRAFGHALESGQWKGVVHLKKKVQVTMKEWTKSEHVAHMRHHKDDYIQAIKNFMPPATSFETVSTIRKR